MRRLLPPIPFSRTAFSRILWCMLWSLWLTIGAPAAVQAEIIAPTVEVPVDVTGADAAAARSAALKQAEVAAFEKLLKEHAPKQASGALAAMPHEQIASFVQSVEIGEETITGNRYQAKVKVQFSPALTQSLEIDKHRSTGAPVIGRGTLLLPVLRDQGSLHLWEENNSWRAALRKRIIEAPDGELVLPTGDLADMSFIDAGQATAAGFFRLRTLAERYGARDVAVVLLTWPDAAGATELPVTLKRISTDGEESETLRVSITPSDSAEQWIDTAAHNTIQALLHQNTANAARSGGKSAAPVALQNTTLTLRTQNSREWAKFTQMLRALPGVNAVSYPVIRPGQAELVVRGAFSSEELGATLREKGFAVTPAAAAGGWVVHVR